MFNIHKQKKNEEIQKPIKLRKKSGERAFEIAYRVWR